MHYQYIKKIVYCNQNRFKLVQDGNNRMHYVEYITRLKVINFIMMQVYNSAFKAGGILIERRVA